MKDDSILQLQLLRADYHRKKNFYSLSFKKRLDLKFIGAHNDLFMRIHDTSDILLIKEQIEEKRQEYIEAIKNIKKPWWNRIAVFFGI